MPPKEKGAKSKSNAKDDAYDDEDDEWNPIAAIEKGIKKIKKTVFIRK